MPGGMLRVINGIVGLREMLLVRLKVLGHFYALWRRVHWIQLDIVLVLLHCFLVFEFSGALY